MANEVVELPTVREPAGKLLKDAYIYDNTNYDNTNYDNTNYDNTNYDNTNYDNTNYGIHWYVATV